jgi:hypothetical protein
VRAKRRQSSAAPSVAGPARSRAFTGVQRSPKPRRSSAHQALPVRARVPELLFFFSLPSSNLVRKANANAQRATTGDSGPRDVTCTSLIDNAGEQDPQLPAQVHWGEFKAYLNKNEQWLAKKDIPVYMSSLIAFSRSQLDALADVEGMTGTASSSKRTATAAFADPNDNSKRQRFEQWGAQVAASINGDSANRSAQITSACSSRRNLKATFSSR